MCHLHFICPKQVRRSPRLPKRILLRSLFLIPGFCCNSTATTVQMNKSKWGSTFVWKPRLCSELWRIGLTTETCTSQQRNKVWKSWLKCILACTAEVQLQRLVPWPERLHASNIRSKARSSAPCFSVLACTPSGNDSSYSCRQKPTCLQSRRIPISNIYPWWDLMLVCILTSVLFGSFAYSSLSLRDAACVLPLLSRTWAVQADPPPTHTGLQ